MAPRRDRAVEFALPPIHSANDILAAIKAVSGVIKRLRESFPDLPDNPNPKTVFLKLRELRNKW